MGRPSSPPTHLTTTMTLASRATRRGLERFVSAIDDKNPVQQGNGLGRHSANVTAKLNAALVTMGATTGPTSYGTVWLLPIRAIQDALRAA